MCAIEFGELVERFHPIRNCCVQLTGLLKGVAEIGQSFGLVFDGAELSEYQERLPVARDRLVEPVELAIDPPEAMQDAGLSVMVLAFSVEFCGFLPALGSVCPFTHASVGAAEVVHLASLTVAVVKTAPNVQCLAMAMQGLLPLFEIGVKAAEVTKFTGFGVAIADLSIDRQRLPVIVGSVFEVPATFVYSVV